MKNKLRKGYGKRIISAVLSVVMFSTATSGCQIKEEIEPEKEFISDIPEDEPNCEDEILIEEPLFDEPILSDQEGEYTDLASYIEGINSVEVQYNHSDYYFDENDYQAMLKLAESTTQCKNGEKYNYNQVYTSILNNNIIFSSEDQISNDLKQALSIAMYNIFSDKSDIGDDFCKLKDIAIINATIEKEGTLGYYIPARNSIPEGVLISEKDLESYYNFIIDDYLLFHNDLIIIDYDKILKSYEKIEEPKYCTFIECLSETLQHEINHGRQFICNCREKSGQLYDSMQYEKNIDNYIEGIGRSLIEASAESQIYSDDINKDKEISYDTFDFTYFDERCSQNLLLLMGMFKDDFSIDRYYEAMFNSDLQMLFDLFELKTEEDFQNFYNIMYSMDSLNGKTKLSYDLIKNGCDTIGELNEEIGNDYKIAIFKIVIKDLLKEINEDKLTLGESLKLYNFVKANILDGEDELEKVNDEYLRFYPENLINQIGAIDDIFYDFIIEHFNVNKQNIDELINSYEFQRNQDYLCEYSRTSFEYYSINDYEDIEYLINKYPIILEMTFCNWIFPSSNDKFDAARENGLIIQKVLKQ